MSAAGITWLCIAVYLLVGLGTARQVSGWAAKEWRYARPGDPEIVMPSVFGGLFWPLAWVWFLLLRPVGTIIGPAFVTWFAKPYRRGTAR